MSKWNLHFHEPVCFTCVLPIRITDLNYGNHLGNDRIVGLMHEARMQFFQSFGYTEMNLAGIGLILRDLSVVLKKEMFYGDVLQFEIAVHDWTSTGFTIDYRVSRTDAGEKVITALAHTTMVCFDYELRKPVRIPEEVLQHRFLRN